MYSTSELDELFQILNSVKGFKLNNHTGATQQYLKKKIVYMGLEFQVKDDKVCYTPLKDKCEAIKKLDSPKTLKQTRAFCSMVNFLSSFLPNLR